MASPAAKRRFTRNYPRLVTSDSEDSDDSDYWDFAQGMQNLAGKIASCK